MSVAWGVYRLIAPCLGAVAPAARLLLSPQERPLWGERLGAGAPAGPVAAWVHAASLGETLAVAPLARELARYDPRARFHFTSTTRTGRARLRALDPRATLAPIDSPQAAARFFARLRPSRLIVLETELWPHWLLRARAAGVPVAVVSARLSARSVPRYARLGGDFRRLVAGLGAVLCQTADDRERWLALGAPAERTDVCGNLKDDALPEPAADRGAARVALDLERAKPLLVLGSLRPGEGRPLGAAWRAVPAALRDAWQVVAVPRHQGSSAEIEREAALASRDAGGASLSAAWRWDARPGVLGGYYAAADVAFVGGTLAPSGGHNPLEPAAAGAAVIVGPHHAAQASGMRDLVAADAVRVVTSEVPLAAALTELLGDPARRAARAAAAFGVAAAKRGAARRAVARLVEWRLWPAAA
jgi:3-deoxy-D-manno-octulosonic-acid transferase